MRPAELVRRATRYLEAHGVDSPQQNAEVLLMNLLDVDRAGLYARSEGLDSATARLFGRALCRRCSGTPLQHLTGEQQFMDLTLRVRPGVFIPRPETEGLVEAAVEALFGTRDPLVVDVGTGTGAVALAIAGRRPDARILATDVSAHAVDLARENAGRLGLEMDVRQGDLLEGVPPDLFGEVDLIVSNPPYVTEEEYDSLPAEVRADPREALVGGVEFHRRLVKEAVSWLRAGGWLVVEVGAAQGGEVRDLFWRAFADLEVLPDLAGRDRVVRGRLRST
jgi:release factor glutamine methyltransferase